MTGFLQDVRLALRRLGKGLGFTLATVAMLALSICANGTVFSWIESTLLNPVPGALRTGELVTLLRGTWNNMPSPPLSYPDYRDLRGMNQSFSGMQAFHADWGALTGGDTPQRIYAANTSGNFFDVLGVKPYLGRFYRMDEEANEGGAPYLVLGYDVWRTHFGADPAILGKSVEINERTLTVIGVAPKGFIGCMARIRDDVWAPLLPIRQEGFKWQIEGRESPWLDVMGRLRPGVSRASATDDLELQMLQLVGAYPNDHLGTNTIFLDPLWRSPFGANGYMAASLPILLGIAGVVLLLTCANIATLMLVRFTSRRREIAVRQSLGAIRIQLVRQMILEGLLLSLTGGALAVLLSSWSAKSLANIIPPNGNHLRSTGFSTHM